MLNSRFKLGQIVFTARVTYRPGADGPLFDEGGAAVPVQITKIADDVIVYRITDHDNEHHGKVFAIERHHAEDGALQDTPEGALARIPMAQKFVIDNWVSFGNIIDEDLS